ncbi:MAG TPA: hypothetical protein VIT88_14675 [Pyrinomonadaceae bacterium]
MFFIQLDKSDAETETREVVSDDAFQIQPSAVWQGYLNLNYFVDGNVDDGIDVAAALRKVADTDGLIPT